MTRSESERKGKSTPESAQTGSNHIGCIILLGIYTYQAHVLTANYPISRCTIIIIIIIVSQSTRAVCQKTLESVLMVKEIFVGHRGEGYVRMPKVRGPLCFGAMSHTKVKPHYTHKIRTGLQTPITPLEQYTGL